MNAAWKYNAAVVAARVKVTVAMLIVIEADIGIVRVTMGMATVTVIMKVSIMSGRCGGQHGNATLQW